MTAATRKGMLDLTPNAITVLERRYLVKDDHGAPVEGPEDLFWRVARTVAAPDARYGASAGGGENLGEAFFWRAGNPGLVARLRAPLKPWRPLGQLLARLLYAV